MDFREPEHIVLLREQVRRFVERETPPERVAVWDQEDRLPPEVLKTLATLGATALTVPEEHGGAGRDILGAMVTIEELSRGSLAVATAYIMCACYGGMNIVESGSEAQKAELLPQLAEGDMIFAYGLTEPDVGADLASVSTRARRDGEDIVVDGRKRFCSGAKVADYIYTLVRTGDPSERHRNLSLVLIPPDAPGVTLIDIGIMGSGGLGTYDVIFEEVRVPAKNLIGGEAGWNRAWPLLAGPALDVEKLGVVAMALGTAAGAVDEAWRYSQERNQFGKAICTYQSIRHMLVEAKTKLHACRLMLYQAAWLANENLPCGVESSMAKLFVSEAARDIVQTCQMVMGAYGYAHGSPMERYVRDSLLMPIIGGSSAIQKNNIANRLGLPR